MSQSRYDHWCWESAYNDDYNPDEIKYSGEDMSDAYQSGKEWYDSSRDLMSENEALRNLLDTRARLDKQLPDEEQTFIKEFMNKYDIQPLDLDD